MGHGGSSSAEETESVSGVDISNLVKANCNWWTAVPIRGKLYGLPCNADCMLIYDVASRQVTSVDTREFARGPGKWRASVVVGSKLYGIPDHANQVLVYDLNSGKASGINTSSMPKVSTIVKVTTKGPFKWLSAVALSGKVYGIPCRAESILVLDTKTKMVSAVDTSKIARGGEKWLGAVAIGGIVYGMPCDAPVILKYDPVTGKVSGISVEHIGTGEKKWLATVSLSGKLYGIPCHAECILVFDPCKETISKVDTGTVAKGQAKWVDGIALQGKIYGIPDEANSILVFDPATGIVSGVDIGSIAVGPAKWQGATVINSTIYCAPHNADEILIFDTSTEVVSGEDTSAVATGNSKWGLPVAVNGQIIAFPFDAEKVLTYMPEAPPAPFSRAVRLPADLPRNLVEDLIVGWLGAWLWLVEDISLPPCVPDLYIHEDAVRFRVLTVYENSMQGSPLRLAVVVVSLPGHGEVLYIIFRGSKFFADYLSDASLCPDTVPFATVFDDTKTFVHHGVYNSIVQLRIHQWSTLCDYMRSAAESGVQKLIVGGHSLGGQYAMAFMFSLFIDKVTHRESPPLVDTARAVSIGSPMIFGSQEGFEVREDVTKFFQENAVNYILLGDPVPRLFSELDVMAFKKQCADYIDDQLPAALRMVINIAAGREFIGDKIGDFLQRTDIAAHVLHPASQYVHVSKIRVLGPKFQCWRPLSVEAIRVRDHDLLNAYIPSFLAAFDPKVAGGIFDEEGKSLV